MKLECMLKEILTSEKSRYFLEEPMSRHTTFRVGGPAQALVSPGNEEELSRLIRCLNREKIDWKILGNGSNLLVSDQGVRGIVISLDPSWAYCRTEDTRLIAGAGERLSRSARLALDSSLTGMEFAAGIPGTVGGALVMNAGAYGSEIRDILVSARIMTSQGEVREIPAGELELGYRHSCIPDRGYTVLEATFQLSPGEHPAIEARMKELSQLRREKQPLEYPSAGSTFKRPQGNFAGKLIEEAGLRGFSVGGARVSDKHCGFVINYDHATASDIMELCRQVSEKVKDSSGVELEMEVKSWGVF